MLSVAWSAMTSLPFMQYRILLIFPFRSCHSLSLPFPRPLSLCQRLSVDQPAQVGGAASLHHPALLIKQPNCLGEQRSFTSRPDDLVVGKYQTESRRGAILSTSYVRPLSVNLYYVVQRASEQMVR